MTASAISYSSDIAVCRALIRGGSRTFHAASFLLPRRVADPAIALYAFCRLADDAVDLGDARRDAVSRLQDRLERVYAGRPLPIAADRAFADVVARYAIPHTLPAALLEGLVWDAAGRRYETLEDLYAYAARVAGAVGAMMSVIMGQRAPEIVARACDLGVAMQLTNIARDIGEDARAGRIYLPLQWLREAHIDPDPWLAAPVFDARIAAMVQRLLDAADVFYARATHGIENLPRICRPGIYAARLLYGEIGRAVERSRFDSVSRRAVVSTRRKLWLLMRMLTRLETQWQPKRAHASTEPQSAFARRHLPDPAMLAQASPAFAQTRFLVDAILPLPPVLQPAPRRFEQRVVWLIDLFERLERRDQLERG